jgi:hypothetical protein
MCARTVKASLSFGQFSIHPFMTVKSMSPGTAKHRQLWGIVRHGMMDFWALDDGKIKRSEAERGILRCWMPFKPNYNCRRCTDAIDESTTKLAFPPAELFKCS